MQRLAGVLMLSVWASMAQASEPLSGDIIQDLNLLQSQLAAGEAFDGVASRAIAQAERLASGNRADQWASALYHQLAAGALVRQQQPAEAADQLASARQRSSVEASQAAKWLLEEAALRRSAGQRSEAITLYEQWLTNREDSQEKRQASWQLVSLLAQEQAWEDAAARLTSLLEQNASLSDAQQSLVLAVFRNAGQSDQALGWLLDDLNTQSAPQAWRQAAGLAQQAGQPGVAAGIWEMAWQLGKFSGSDDRLMLIRLHMAGGTPARAAEHIEEALQSEEMVRDEQALRLLATAWQQARHVEKALQAWQALVEETQVASDWRQYGQLAYAWGKDAQAEEALQQAFELGDQEVEPWLANFH